MLGYQKQILVSACPPHQAAAAPPVSLLAPVPSAQQGQSAPAPTARDTSDYAQPSGHPPQDKDSEQRDRLRTHPIIGGGVIPGVLINTQGCPVAPLSPPVHGGTIPKEQFQQLPQQLYGQCFRCTRDRAQKFCALCRSWLCGACLCQCGVADNVWINVGLEKQMYSAFGAYTFRGYPQWEGPLAYPARHQRREMDYKYSIERLWQISRFLESMRSVHHPILGIGELQDLAETYANLSWLRLEVQLLLHSQREDGWP